MSREMIQDWEKKIQEAKKLLQRVEAKAVRVREAIVTFEMEKRASEQTAGATHN
jgi:hypothetical protein